MTPEYKSLPEYKVSRMCLKMLRSLTGMLLNPPLTQWRLVMRNSTLFYKYSSRLIPKLTFRNTAVIQMDCLLPPSPKIILTWSIFAGVSLSWASSWRNVYKIIDWWTFPSRNPSSKCCAQERGSTPTFHAQCLMPPIQGHQTVCILKRSHQMMCSTCRSRNR